MPRDFMISAALSLTAWALVTAVVKSPEAEAFEASLHADLSESTPDLAEARPSLVTPLGRWCDLDKAVMRLWIASTILGTSALSGPQASFALTRAASVSAFLASAASFRELIAELRGGAPVSTALE